MLEDHGAAGGVGGEARRGFGGVQRAKDADDVQSEYRYDWW